MEITERWLMDTAGFPAFKAGRQIYRAGGVTEVSYRDQLLRGVIVAGRKRRVAGLKINGPTDLENLCRCPQSQRDGAICDHSIAVAFAWMNRSASGSDASPGNGVAGDSKAGGQGRGAALNRPPQKNPDSPLSVVVVKFEKDFVKIWEKQKLPLRLSSAAIASSADGDQALSLPDSPHALAACARFSRWLEANGVDFAKPPPFLVLSRAQAMDFFAAGRDYPWLQLADNRTAKISSDELRPRLAILPAEAKDSSGEADAAVSLRLDRPGAELGQLLWNSNSSGATCAWLYSAIDSTFYPLAAIKGGDASAGSSSSALLEELLAAEEDGSAVERPMLWVVGHLDELNRAFAVDTAALPAPIRLAKAPPRHELELEGSLNAVTGRLLAIYGSAGGDLTLPAGLENGLDGAPVDDFPLADSEQPGLYLRRNLEAELGWVTQLDASGFRAADDRGRWVLQGRDAVLALFGSELPEWQQQGLEIRLGERLQRVTHGLERVTPQVSVSEVGESWFECEFSFSSAAGSSMTESEVRRLLASGRREIALPGGNRQETGGGAMPPPVGVVDTAAVNEWSDVLEDLDAQQTRPGHFRIAACHREFLETSLKHDNENDRAGIDAGADEMDEAVEQALGDLREKLRDYQTDAVAWLCGRLLKPGVRGALLADEMGLGKTVQTLAALRVLRTIGGHGFESRPSLVVAPTSLLANWAAEAARFAPELEVVVLHGGERKKTYARLGAADLVITSYGVLTRDIDKLTSAGNEFALAVLDEASFVRNPQTKVARSALRIPAEARLALTGTPVENSVRDLWSIMEFAVPGCLGTREDFKQRYELPLAADPVPAQLFKRLHRRVGPHLLRRTKRRVASDLPEKIEQVLYCDLTPEQRALYAQLVDVSRQAMRSALGSKSGGGVNQARMAALTALLRLRQLCCDPRLLNAASDGDSGAKGAVVADSAKLDLLLETLREAREGGHRVLVFSQFVSMLKLIGDQLSAEECNYAYLDGATSVAGRASEVKRFQESEQLSVFLISLKAGGYGLNLTAADTVIHYDPWWNPAVEAQATDRAHRIGQERPVTSYKLICRGTVEEKILRLQERKAAALGAAIGIDEQAPLMRGLDDDDLREVLEL